MITEDKYEEISSSNWSGVKAILITEQRNLSGDVIAKNVEVIICNKSEKRMYQGENLNAYKFDIKLNGILVHGVRCTNLKVQ
ncbi:hypothetical protein [Aquimarina sp. 2201CG14-23]|uniref:hypothetical protein n=1 Tax=Aquimarina mycalae TaxID=3040073 RepID=UPI002477E966|nr:hypothetical protein [Aquimarina sp. 2201CG14-23]MDH7447240.1 hypothetical protein [Aquimarina sp. 2201CG14-23]